MHDYWRSVNMNTGQAKRESAGEFSDSRRIPVVSCKGSQVGDFEVIAGIPG